MPCSLRKQRNATRVGGEEGRLFSQAKCPVSRQFSNIPIRWLSSLQGYFKYSSPGGQFFVCISILNEWVRKPSYVSQMDTNLMNCNKLIYIDPGYDACRTSHESNLIWFNLKKAISILNVSTFPLTQHARISTVGLAFIQTPSISWAKPLTNITNILNLLPPQGFGPEAKTRGGTLGVPACIHIRNFKM